MHAFGRILTVVSAKDAIKIGGVLLESEGASEELFGCHGKELGLVPGRVGVEESFLPLPGEITQPKEFPGAHFHPLSKLVMVDERGGAVGGAVKHVELMSKFMVNDVVTLTGVTRSVQDGVPDEDHRPPGDGLAENGDIGFHRAVDTLENTGLMFRNDNGGGVDKDRFDVAIVIVREPEKEQACLSGNGDADLIGEVEAAAPFPVLLCQKDLDQREEFVAFAIR